LFIFSLANRSFSLKKIATALVGALAYLSPLAMAQPGSYLGPGVLSRGAGDIGTRAGAQVDLRFFASVSGVYDTGLQPYAVDSKGNLVTLNGLYGVEASFGAYGTHRWRESLLGLDYLGNFTHYTNTSSLDATNQSLRLGYTYQKSRRLGLDFREVAGLSHYGYGSPGFYSNSAAPTDFVNNPTALLFDNRYYYFQTTMDVNVLQSARTIYTFGGDGFWVRRQGVGLAGTNGYNLRGSVQHRRSKTQTFGVTYEHIHFDFPPAFGQADIDVGELFFSAALSRRWTFSLSGGAASVEIEGIQQTTLDPVIAALLGTSFAERAFYSASIVPSGTASLTGRYKSSAVSFGYSQHIVPGNGLYLTSQQRNGTGSYSYTGIRNWSLGISGGYSSLNGLGQGLQPYSSFTGGLAATYRISGAFHATARFDARDQQIDVVGYKHTGYRATIGVAFSPGDIPLSLW
jgi:hypothetical protein